MYEASDKSLCDSVSIAMKLKYCSLLQTSSNPILPNFPLYSAVWQLETLHIWARMQERHNVVGGDWAHPHPEPHGQQKKHLASKIDSVNSIAAQRLGSRLTTRELGAWCAECM
jgi:hypothetical protein